MMLPGQPHALNGAAWLLVARPDKQGEFPEIDQAVAWAREACEGAPKRAGYHNTLGVACYRQGQWKEAIEALETSVGLGVDDPHNWLFIAMCHWRLGDKTKAQEWHDKSLAWAEANPQAVSEGSELQAFFAEAADLLATDANSAEPQ